MAGEGIFVMSREELRRVSVVQRVLDGELTQGRAAEVLGVCERQVRRLVRRVREEGEEGVIHRGRGRSSSRAIGRKVRRRVIALCRGRYVGFGPTLAAEKLRDEEGIVLSRETLRSWFRAEHLSYRRRRGRAHRRWRERKSCFGEMVQVDGSHHDWFEGRAGGCVLMGYVDDATGTAFGRFYPFEGTVPALDSFGRYVRRYGIPMSVYLDKHSTYKSTRRATIEEELRDVEPMSEVERALVELGVKVVHADSPQAKGRIERVFRTLQDRLVKEMRLRRIGGIEEANEFLEEYLPVYNERFRVEPVGEADLHRRIPRGVMLERVLCVRRERFLRNDFTVAYNGKLYQIEDRTRAKKVIVEERIDGSMAITYKGRVLKFTEIGERPKRREGPGSYRPAPRKVYRPPREHPWNTFRESPAAHASAQRGKNGQQARRVPARTAK
jgi:transposase